MLQQTLARFPHFQVLQETDLDWIVASAQQASIQPEEELIREGESVQSIYLLLSGRLTVVVSQRLRGGLDSPAVEQSVRPIATLMEGAIVGEMSFLDSRPPAATIKALEASQVLVLPKPLLAQKLNQDSGFSARFYHLLSLKLSRQLRDLSELLIQNQILPGEPLRKVLLAFSVLDDRDVAWAIAEGLPQKSAPGTVLIAEGETVGGMYLLLDGILNISIAEQEIAKSLKGEILGEMSFVETGNASATVTVEDTAFTLLLPREKLNQKLQQDQSFAARFYRAVALVLTDRWRDRLFRRGFAHIARDRTQLLSEDLEDEDEIDLDMLDSTAIAAARFDWAINQLRGK